jgi:twinkle protein
LNESDFHYEYLEWRGILPTTMEKYGALTKVNQEGKPVEIGFPYDTGTKVRTIQDKDFISKGDMKGPKLFGMELFSAGSSKSITIFEGELDALSGYQILKYPCVSIKGASSAFSDCSAHRDYLDSFEKIYIAFDNDEAGRAAREKVSKLFEASKIYHVKLTKHKDCNDYLQRGEGDEWKRIWWNSKRGDHIEGVLSSLSEFDSLIDNAEIKASVPYPFPTLNEMTYGIRTGECVLITALEGVGKTEILRAIEYSILKNTQDNLGIIHLEETSDRTLKGLASYEIGVPCHLKHFGIPDETVKETIHTLFQRDDRVFLTNIVDTSDPHSFLSLLRYLVAVRGCRYVFLDHISDLVSGASGDDDERKLLDYLSTQFALMVKELDFALIFISHVNDDGKTRGSRYISKASAVRIDLSRNLTAESPEERNKTFLTISKNRFGSNTGPAGVLRFDPGTFRITEMKTTVELPT